MPQKNFKDIEEGKKTEKIEIAKNLLAMGMDLKAIAKATGLSENEIADLRV